MKTKKNNPVGYKHPPKHTQFKPGHSGNPKGRPKGVKNLATDLHEELQEKIQVTEASQPQVVTKQRAVIKTMIAKALKGDARAATVLIGLIQVTEQHSTDKNEVKLLDKEDQKILDLHNQKILKLHATNKTKKGDKS